VSRDYRRSEGHSRRPIGIVATQGGIVAIQPDFALIQPDLVAGATTHDQGVPYAADDTDDADQTCFSTALRGDLPSEQFPSMNPMHPYHAMYPFQT